MGGVRARCSLPLQVLLDVEGEFLACTSHYSHAVVVVISARAGGITNI